MDLAPLSERVSRLEGRVEEHSRFFEGLEGRLLRIEERLNALDQKIDRFREELSGRIDQLSGRIEQVRQELHQDIGQLGQELRQEMVQLREDSNHRFLWLLGVQITMWITIILAILIRVR